LTLGLQVSTITLSELLCVSTVIRTTKEEEEEEEKEEKEAEAEEEEAEEEEEEAEEEKEKETMTLAVCVPVVSSSKTCATFKNTTLSFTGSVLHQLYFSKMATVSSK
jgi:TATA-binding protein-associated factor Taf7